MLKPSLLNTTENLIHLNKGHAQLTDIFFSGCTQQERVGVEFEKLPVDKKTFKAAAYADVAKFLTEFRNGKRQGVYEGNAILGMTDGDGSISLEPGSQTELSLTPRSSIVEIQKYLEKYNRETRQIGERFGIYWLGYGIQPVSTYKSMQIIPKKRYEFMTKYLPTQAKKPLVMMRETAGIQSSFDYKDEADAMRKFGFALKLSPIISAAFANSPIRNGRLTRYKSFRASSWLETDNDRCGLVSSRAFKEGFTFADYAEILLDVPMIFIERRRAEAERQNDAFAGAVKCEPTRQRQLGQDGEKTALKVENRTFRQFMKDGYEGFRATVEDWELHLSLYFPDVRLKSYIEIRNHDNQRSPYIPAVPAFWKGLMYNEAAMEAVEAALSDFSYFDFEYLRRNTPVLGLGMKVKTRSLKDLAREIFAISYESLRAEGRGEEVLLAPFKALIDEGLTPADVIIKNWKGAWGGDVAKLVEFSRL